MKVDTDNFATLAVGSLIKFIERAKRDTAEIIAEANLSKTISYFDELREEVRGLQKQVSEMQNHLDTLSYDLIPKMFVNANVKTITVPGVGRATIAVHWTAKMLNKARAFEWLHKTGNQGLIIETVNAGTLGAFAKAQVLQGLTPLPSDIFKVGTAPFVTITPGNVVSEEEFAAGANPDA